MQAFDECFLRHCSQSTPGSLSKPFNQSICSRGIWCQSDSLLFQKTPESCLLTNCPLSLTNCSGINCSPKEFSQIICIVIIEVNGNILGTLNMDSPQLKNVPINFPANAFSLYAF